MTRASARWRKDIDAPCQPSSLHVRSMGTPLTLLQLALFVCLRMIANHRGKTYLEIFN